MTFPEFTQLPEASQLAAVYATGAYVATRWQEVYEAVHLYQLPGGFFVELTYDTETNEVQYLVPFEAGRKGDRLSEYASAAKLPGRLSDAE